MARNNKNKDTKNDQDSPLSSYAKYSGLAFQMGAVIAITVWGGVKLDEMTGNEKPIFTIILSLFGVFTAIYVAIKDFIKK